MEGTGIYWKAPFEALEDAGIEPILYHARFVRQTRAGRATWPTDCGWPALKCLRFRGRLKRAS